MSIYTITSDLNSYNYDYFQQDDVCRLCWNKHAEREIISKDTKNISDIKNELVDKIRYCLNIDIGQISRPNKACENCYDLIEKFYEFKFFCTETQRKLEEIITREGGNDPKHVDKNFCIIKEEKDDPLPNVEKAGYLNLCSDDLHNSDIASEPETLQADVNDKMCKIKSKYKPIRTPTYCNICRIDFESKEIFSDHNAICHGIEDGGMYKCFGCEKRFKSRKTRLGHEINYCKGLKDGYQCSICDRYLPKRRVYENHMRNHRDNVQVELPEDIFKCLKCYEVFNTKTSLKNHMEVHNVEKKNFVCESCGRVFTRQDYLHKHKLTHTGVKQHVCPHCGFRTTQKSSLTVHIRKHTGERPYSCDVCPQRCVSSSNLRAHRRRHLGLKKYECTICCKKFGYKVSLEEHVASTHERSQSHPCPHCGAAYTRLRGLRRHLLAKHAKQKSLVKEQHKDDSDMYLKAVNETQPNTDDGKVESMLNADEVNMGFGMKNQDAAYIV